MKIELYSLYEDERPLKGSVGLLDWHIKGAISRHIIAGHIKGQWQELTYFPVTTQKNQRHILLVGLGPKKNRDTLKNQQNEFLQKLSATLKKLKCSHVALNKDGFEFLDLKKMESELKPVRVC